MTIACPYCTTRYLLPDHLLGPGGARVRCPSCQRSFVVPADADRGPAAVEASSATPLGAILNPSEEAAAPAASVSGEPIARTGSGALPAPPPATARADAPRDASGVSPADAQAGIARAVLAALAEHHGEAIEAAGAAGRLLSEFGPALFDAYDDYRRRVGKGAMAAPFRAALQERWNVDLPGADLEA